MQLATANAQPDNTVIMCGIFTYSLRAGCRDRTRDPVITNHVLYQLS